MKRILSFCVAVVLFLTMVPIITTPNAKAAEDPGRGFITLSEEESTIAPGITQTIGTVRKKYNSQQLVYYTMTVDLENPNAHLYANYKDNQWEPHTKGQYGLQEVKAQMDAAQARHSNPADQANYIPNYTVVGGVNGTGYNMNTGQTRGILVMEGHIVQEDKINASGSPEPFFAIDNNNQAHIYWNEGGTDWAEQKNNVKEAINGFIYPLIKNGEIVCGTQNAPNARTAIGVTADNKVVMLVADGKQAPFSEGCDMYELAEILRDMGCVDAVNLDGGGSTTFVSRPEGEETYRVVNKPCDGLPRAVSASLLVVSTAPDDKVFDRASIDADNEYITPGGTVNLTAKGITAAGSPVEIPSDVTWSYDGDFGTINGSGNTAVFTANQDISEGDTEVTVNMVRDDKPVGSITFHIVKPNIFDFTAPSYAVPYGKEIDIEFRAAYSTDDAEYEVKLRDEDITLTLDKEAEMGVLTGRHFTAKAMPEDPVTVEGTLTASCFGIQATASFTVGRGSEVIFDFENDASESCLYTAEYAHPEYNYDSNAFSFKICNAETGKVHSGSQALAFTMDWTTAPSDSKGQGFNQLWGTRSATSIDAINITGAVGFGGWVWRPDEDVSTTFSLYLSVQKEVGKEGAEIQSADAWSYSGENVDGGHWEFVYFDLTKFAGKEIKISRYWIDYMLGSTPEPIMSKKNKLTYYLDDFYVDYSSVVDDRIGPEISEITTTSIPGSEDVQLKPGEIADFGDIDSAVIRAKVTDNIGVTEVEAYVDGTPVSTELSSGNIVTEDLRLAPGVHTITLVAKDALENTTTVKRQFRMSGNVGAASVSVVASKNNAFTDKIPMTSVFWLDVEATDVSKIDGVEMVLDLNNISLWELDHADVSPKFKLTWEFEDGYAKTENIATITLARIAPYEEGDDSVIASLPIRTWGTELPYTYTATSKKEITLTPEYIWENELFHPIDVSVQIDRGEIIFSSDYVSPTLPCFSGEEVQVNTELYTFKDRMTTEEQGKTSWHVHDNELKTLDTVAATCTTDGYSDRTYCETCKSVVDWGKTLEATGHSYGFDDDNVLKCLNSGCGELYNGVREEDGKTYKDGKPLSGWQEDDAYYVDGVMNVGAQQVENLWYNFGEDGVCKDRKTITGFFTYNGVTYYAEEGVKRVAVEGDDNSDWFFIGEDGYHIATDGTVHNVAEDGNITPIKYVDNRKCLVSGYKIYTCPECGDQHSSELLWYEGHKWRDAEHGDYYCTVCGTKGIDIAKCEVTFAGTYFTYTGGSILAKHTLTYTDEKGNTRTLWCESDRDGRDGLSTYTNNVDVGMATLKVEGRGDFYGEIYAQFQIVPASVDTLTAVQKEHGTLELSWTPALGAGYYSVWYRENEQGDWKELATNITGTTYTVEGLEMGERYSYRVASRTDVDGKTYYCTNWSNTVAGSVDHIWVEDAEKSTPATCTKDGLSVRYCEVCGESEEQVVPATGHKVETWTTTVPPTASSDGSREGTCSVCGETVTENIPKLPPVQTGTGSSTSPESKQETVTNEDGSTTTTTTKPDGSKTETTTQTDGTVTEKNTEKSGVVTETTTKPDNTVTEKVTQTDGSATEKTTTPDGVVGQKNTDAEGEVTSVEVVIPKEAEKQDVVTAPVEVPAAKSAAEAPEISVRTESAESKKVEIPVTEFGPGTVAVVVHEDGTEEIVRDCVMGENGVVLNVEGDVTLKIVDNTETFEDVEEANHWATDAVEFVAARELFNGTGENKFTPNGAMTRGMMVTVLYRLAYEPDTVAEQFADVPSGQYYSDAVAWAQNAGVVTGYDDNTFAPDDNVKREQLVTILYRYAKKMGYATTASGTLAGYADASSVSGWAKDAMSWAIDIGLVNGVDATHLAPANNATRAEVATILMRFCEKVVK